MERQVIAHELHDEFGPHLFALRASAAVLGRKLGDDPPSRAAASAIEAQVEALQAQNRRILADLRPAALEELGLAEALEALVAHWRRAEPRVAVTLDVDPRVETMSDRASLMAYRFVQEAMTNAFRHAGAMRIDVSLRFETPVLEPILDAGLGDSSFASPTTVADCRAKLKLGWGLPACATGSGCLAAKSPSAPGPEAASWSRRGSARPERSPTGKTSRRSQERVPENLPMFEITCGERRAYV